MKPFTGITLTAITLITIACSNMENAAEAPSESAPAALTSSSTQPQASPAANANIPTDLYSDGSTKLIKTANYRFEVNNVHESISAIEVAIRKHNAFISFSNLKANDYSMEGKITIRVNNENFQDLLKEIDQQAKFVNFRDVKTEDVSKQFVDLESRLRSKREVEQRYMEILRKKAGTIEELLRAEQQIGELHEEIEATVSRINYLKDEVRYSTINLEIYQEIKPAIAETTPGTLDDMRQAVVFGWKGFVRVFIAILYLWPLGLISAVTMVLYRILKKRRAIKDMQSV